MSLLQHLALSSPLSYLASFLVPMLDAILPVCPVEPIVIALGITLAGGATHGSRLLVGLAACRAFAGDNLCCSSAAGRPLAERSSSPGRKAPASGPGRPALWTGSATG